MLHRVRDSRILGERSIAAWVRAVAAALCLIGARVGVAQALVITEYVIPTPSTNPRGITAGPDGNLWFTELNGNAIRKITTSGAITEFSLLPSVNSQPEDITRGPDGNLWFAETNNLIGQTTTSGAITQFSGLGPVGSVVISGRPFGIAAGPVSDGNLWFSEYDGSRIGRINLKFHRSETLFHGKFQRENEGNVTRIWLQYVAM